MNYMKLSQLMSYILRHDPQKYGLEPDLDGWVNLDEFLEAIKSERDFQGVTAAALEKAMADSDKRRHEIHGGRIRAVYGHSLQQRIKMVPAEPPELLYHGTSRSFLSSIHENGLSPKERQYVHLSQDRQTAARVGRRRDEAPAVLLINAGQAWRDGHKFYQVDDAVWLADFVPPDYIREIAPGGMV